MQADEFSRKRVLCIGEALWDVLPSGEVPGGAPMNAALHLQQLGVDTSFASGLGQDDPGDRLQACLSRKGLNTALIQRSSQVPTGRVTVQLDEHKNASYIIHEPAAWDFIELDPALTVAAESADILVFGSLATRRETSRNTILSLLDRIPMSLLDINLRTPHDTREKVEPLLRKASMLKMNDEEYDVIMQWNRQSFADMREGMLWMSEHYELPLICTTLGSRGALLCVNQRFYHHPGYPAAVVDTVGAGDSFLAAFVASLVYGRSWPDALDLACRVGAFVATQQGATPRLPQVLIRTLRQ